MSAVNRDAARSRWDLGLLLGCIVLTTIACEPCSKNQSAEDCTGRVVGTSCVCPNVEPEETPCLSSAECASGNCTRPHTSLGCDFYDEGRCDSEPELRGCLCLWGHHQDVTNIPADGKGYLACIDPGPGG